MGRSVVFNSSPRCERCRLPPRWCVCEAHRPVESALGVTVLMHHMEVWRPSSTGHLINRVLPAAQLHQFRAERGLVKEEVVMPGRELWILHPSGESLPTDTPAEKIQVMLLDGTWIQAGTMMKELEGWGRRVSLPMTGDSRYWLRAQAGEGRFSTMEALLFLLGALGLKEEHAQIQVQFELHVYAGLCARGKKREALEFLHLSPVRDVLLALVPKLTPWAKPSRSDQRGGRTWVGDSTD